MIEKDKTYVVMGLLDSDSIAYAIGQVLEQGGGKVIYTVQNERMKRIFFDRNKKWSQEEKDRLNIRYCDVTVDDEVRQLFEDIGPVAGVTHSIAFANPKTCLGPEFHTDAYDDLKTGFHISAVSLATVTRYAQKQMSEGGGIVTLSFASQLAFAYYNWMGVNKAALEATVRALARRHGKDLVRVNAVSAGPVSTKAAGAIHGFEELGKTWERISPLPWDPVGDKMEVAYAAAFLMGPYSKKISGQVLYVDGGASVIGGELLPHERA
jgi:enoyl-[acyl-carrier-protein] reductase (NADH)